LIKNSYDELVDFLIANVEGFAETKRTTIRPELMSGNEPPKAKRVKIEPGE
jgi:hypothetical protein